MAGVGINIAEAHLNRNQIESNLSVPGIQGCHENALYKSFEMRPLDPWYVCRLASLSPKGQPESRPDPEAGPKGILMLTHRHIKWG